MAKYEVEMIFERRYKVRWNHVDQNGHASHTSFLEFGTDARIDFFEANGIPMETWNSYGGGPILLEQNIRYHKELHLNEEIRVTFSMTKIHPDPRFYFAEHEIFNAKGQKSATITMLLAYMNLEKRKIEVAPQPILDMFSILYVENPQS